VTTYGLRQPRNSTPAGAAGTGIADQLRAPVVSTAAVSLMLSIVTLPLIIHITS
jgi:hypothetical protein